MMRTHGTLRAKRNIRRSFLPSSLLCLGLSAVVFLAAIVGGEACCKHRAPPYPQQYTQEFPRQKYYRWGEYYENQAPWLDYYRGPRPCMSLNDCDRKAYGESGTRGRMGLGADPAHPEGPGNVSD
jgi:hypothetical protein